MGTLDSLWWRNRHCEGIRCIWVVKYHRVPLLTPLATSPFLVATLLICLVVTFLTEVTSNTATTTLLMPILAAAAIASDIDPLLLMIPAALSASCAFMLPVATAPNAVVYGSGMLPVAVMARTGVRLNLLAVMVITLGLTLRSSF